MGSLLLTFIECMSDPKMPAMDVEQPEAKKELPKPKFMVVVDAKGMPNEMGEYQVGEYVIIREEGGDNYYGTGFMGAKGANINQKFPQANVRELNSTEMAALQKQPFEVPGLGLSKYKLTSTGEIDFVLPLRDEGDPAGIN